MKPRLSKLLMMFAASLFVLPSVALGQHYIQANLVSDGFVPAQNLPDSQLKNPWGLARSATSPWWVSDNNAGVTTVYNGNTGAKLLSVTIPPPLGAAPPSTPTGAVFNGSATDFLLAPTKPARFIFVTEDGTISGWNPAVNANAVLVVDNSKKNAVYKGATIGEKDGKRFLFVANFHSGRIEMYDTSFHLVPRNGDDFQGAFDGDAAGNFVPFNVQAVGESLVVTFAKQDADKHDDVAGAGLGFVAIFDTSGKRLARLEHGPWMNAPWGVALAPRDFGEFSSELLIGQFGSGQIAAFNPFSGKFLGLMRNPNNSILTIDGLWALGFGNGGGAGPTTTLFFTAGLNDEKDGLFGTLVPIASELAEADEP